MVLSLSKMVRSIMADGFKPGTSSRYPVRSPLGLLEPGQHLRLRTCCCTSGFVDLAMHGMLETVVTQGRSAIWIEGYRSPALPRTFMGICSHAGREADLRVVDFQPETEVTSGTMLSATHTLPAVAAETLSRLQSFQPKAFSDTPDIDLLDSETNHVAMIVMPASNLEGMESKMEQVSALLLEGARRKKAAGNTGSVVFLSFVSSREASPWLAPFLVEMRDLGVSVILGDAVYQATRNDPGHDVEVNPLLSLRLDDACWTARRDDGVQTPRDGLRWNEHAFLVHAGHDLVSPSWQDGMEVKMPHPSPFDPATCRDQLITMRNGMVELSSAS